MIFYYLFYIFYLFIIPQDHNIYSGYTLLMNVKENIDDMTYFIIIII